MLFRSQLQLAGAGDPLEHRFGPGGGGAGKRETEQGEQDRAAMTAGADWHGCAGDRAPAC